MKLFTDIQSYIEEISKEIPSEERLKKLEPLITYIQSKIEKAEEVNLNFICTHNSRRSQFSQVWAHIISRHLGIPANCFSGGVEVTAFHQNALESLKRAGILVEVDEGDNPIYRLFFSDQESPIRCFSKLFDDAENNAINFAAIMTCSDADENCPFIPGTEKRIALNYEDPKAFDNKPECASKYDERSFQIASELYYVFNSIRLNRI